MDKYRWLLKDWGFWIIVYAILVTISLIWVSISYSKHECPKPDPIDEVHFKLNDSNNKIEFHEYVITKDSTIIWNSNQSQLDSLRAERFAKYLLGDTLYH